MFHNGDLQSGISRAITESKLVACFIREDDNEESRIWEEEWLGQNSRTVSIGTENYRLSNIFSLKAVILRIDYGSQEASFLNAFCLIEKAPAFVVINSGQVLEKVEGGISKEEFIRRISAALGLEVSFERREDFHRRREEQGNRGPLEVADAEDFRRSQQAQKETEDAESEVQEAIARSQQRSLAPSASSSAASEQPETQPTASKSNQTSDPTPESTTQDPASLSTMFPDRAQEHEDEKAKREAAEKAERIARSNARRKEAEEAHAEHMGKAKGKKSQAATEAQEKEKARRDWLVQQKQRKEEAKRDRERILAQIEADKRDRKARSQQAKEEAQASSSSPLSPSIDAASRRIQGAGGTCSLVIRLFDGSSIKNRFEPSTTLATGVRNWIKETASTAASPESQDIPFTFKQILSPLPSRTISISEENDTLQSLGLCPTATLVLVPISTYTEAYAGGERGYMSTALNAAYSVTNTATSLASYALSYLPGFGGTAASSEHAAAGGTPAVQPVDATGGSGIIKVRSLADQRKQSNDKTEFYNGNSSAFEGRKDDDEDKR